MGHLLRNGRRGSTLTLGAGIMRSSRLEFGERLDLRRRLITVVLLLLSAKFHQVASLIYHPM